MPRSVAIPAVGWGTSESNLAHEIDDNIAFGMSAEDAFRAAHPT